jgi:hypothetical protein
LNYELCENKTFISEIHKKYMRYYKRDVKNITSLKASKSEESNAEVKA